MNKRALTMAEYLKERGYADPLLEAAGVKQIVSCETISNPALPNRGRGPRWTPEQDATLRALRCSELLSVPVIAQSLGRSVSAVQQRLHALKIVLQPHAPGAGRRKRKDPNASTPTACSDGDLPA